jgi:hypothetical protein
MFYLCGPQGTPRVTRKISLDAFFGKSASLFVQLIFLHVRLVYNGGPFGVIRLERMLVKF